MKKLREAYRQEKASAALEGIEPPEETAELREDWLSGKVTTEQHLARLNEHYRTKAKGELKEK